MSKHEFRPHAAHDHHEEDSAEAVPSYCLPSAALDCESARVRGKLEELDDVIFEAVNGEPHALERAHRLWPEVVEEIGWEHVEESREQYLRYAVEITHHYHRQEIRKPEKAIAALEIISLLTKN